MNQISVILNENDERIKYLKNGLKNLCPNLGEKGAKWNNERINFTEYADTKRWLENQVGSLIANSDNEEHRIATFHGGIEMKKENF